MHTPFFPLPLSSVQCSLLFWFAPLCVRGVHASAGVCLYWVTGEWECVCVCWGGGVGMTSSKLTALSHVFVETPPKPSIQVIASLPLSSFHIKSHLEVSNMGSACASMGGVYTKEPIWNIFTQGMSFA